MENISQEVIDLATNHYLDSGDFNGIHYIKLINMLGIKWEELLPDVISLVKTGFIRIIDETTDVNPHIIRTGFDPIEVQIRKLEKNESLHACLYPSSNHLNSVVDEDSYRDEPYKLLLALGKPQ